MERRVVGNRTGETSPCAFCLWGREWRHNEIHRVKRAAVTGHNRRDPSSVWGSEKASLFFSKVMFRLVPKK